MEERESFKKYNLLTAKVTKISKVRKECIYNSLLCDLCFYFVSFAVKKSFINTPKLSTIVKLFRNFYTKHLVMVANKHFAVCKCQRSPVLTGVYTLKKFC